MIWRTANAIQTLKRPLLLAVLVAGIVGGVAAQTHEHAKRGLTRGFFVSGFPNGHTEALGTDFTEIQRLSSLPAGNYIANASAVLSSSNDPQLHLVDCIFMIGGFNQGELARGLLGGTVNNFASLPLTLGFSITTTSDLVLACRADVSAVVFSQSSPITAIRVDSLTAQP